MLHHVGLSDEVIVELPAGELTTFGDVDHLTSLWIDGLRTAGEAMDDLVDFMRRLRAECPWDQEQTHASLTRHLLEEAYETLDALEAFVRVEDDVASDESAHVEEELGDLLFQIVFHAELGDEEELFNLATIADSVRDKLIGRHPHVFGDVQVNDSNDVAAALGSTEARREGPREHHRRHRVATTGADPLHETVAQGHARWTCAATRKRRARSRSTRCATSRSSATVSMTRSPRPTSRRNWGDAVAALVEMAQWAGVDLEGVLRDRARSIA